MSLGNIHLHRTRINELLADENRLFARVLRLRGGGPLQVRVFRVFAGKIIGHEEPLPPSSFAEATIVCRNDMRLSFSSLKHHFVTVDLANDPILVNLVGIEFAVWRRGYVFRPRSRRKAMFFSGVDNPIIRLKRTGHLDVPALSKACHVGCLAKPFLEEAFFNATLLNESISSYHRP